MINLVYNFEKDIQKSLGYLEDFEYIGDYGVIEIALDAYSQEGIDNMDSTIDFLLKQPKYKSYLVLLNNYNQAEKYNFPNFNEESIYIKVIKKSKKLFINQGKRWKEKEYLILILMYLTGILLYYQDNRKGFLSLKYIIRNKQTYKDYLLVTKLFFHNSFGKVLCKLRSKESILNKLDYNIGYYPIVKQAFIGYKRKENKDATTKFKKVSKLLLDDHACSNINKLEVLAQKLQNTNMQNTIFGHMYSNLVDLSIKKVISLNDHINIAKTIDNLFK